MGKQIIEVGTADTEATVNSLDQGRHIDRSEVEEGTSSLAGSLVVLFS